jgi:hypothetical protein
MKKRDKKLAIHRETLRRLQAGELVRANGQAEELAGAQTSCIKPNCCTIDTILGTE